MAPVVPPTDTPLSNDQSHPIAPSHPKPLLRLSCTDLRDKQTQRILREFDPHAILDHAVITVLSLLYPDAKREPNKDESPWPATRSVTFIVDTSLDGVAYTTGIPIDNDHKEIHISTNYVGQIADRTLQREVSGVLCHEMVHCWQWVGQGSAPGGLVEGIADWVRLRANLAPPHWKREINRDAGPWRGYQHSAYFLDWLEQGWAGEGVGGKGTVPKVNAALRAGKYDEDKLWKPVVGKELQILWNDYCDWLENDLKADIDQRAGPKDDKTERR